MKAKTFISLMLVLMVVIGSLFAFAAPAQREIQKNACPAGTVASPDPQVQAGDGMIWQSVSRHLLSVVQ